MTLMGTSMKPLAAILLLSAVGASALFAVDKDKGKFQPGPASAFPAKQTESGVTIAVQAYDQEPLTKSAFGKVNPNEHGVLPVLVVIENKSNKAIKLENLRVEYLDFDRRKVEPTPAKDLPYLEGPRRPNFNGTPLPGMGRKKKSPFLNWEFEGRALSAKMLPPGESTFGFVYFQTRHQPGSRLQVAGLEEAGTNKELFYFDIPF
jgi:hypothetical protein